MKLLKLFYLLIFLPLSLMGQSKDTVVNAPILNLEEIIPVLNKGFIVFKTDSIESPTVLDFSYFNLDNKLISTVSIPTSRTNEFFALEKLLIWNNKLIICSSLYQPGFKKNHLLYYEYNLPDLSLNKSEVLLKTVAPPSVYVPYFINLSPDSTKLVAMGWNYTGPKETAKIQAVVFDKDLEQERQCNYTFTFKNERLAIEDILIDNTSKIYITGNNYRGSLKSPTSPSKIDHFVVGLFPEQNEKYWPIKKEKYNFQYIKYALNKAQKLVGSGYWSKGLKSGIGFIEIESDNVTNITTHQILYKDFKAAYKKNLPSFAASKNWFSGYNLTHLICKEDAYFIIGENNLYETQYADILVIKLTKEKDLIWLSRIPKFQNTLGIGPKFASFSLIQQKEKFYFLFNDIYSNYKNGNNEYLNVVTALNAKPALAELALSTGAIKRKMLSTLLKKDFLFLPTYSQSITQEDIIVIGTRILSKAGEFSLKKVKIRASPN